MSRITLALLCSIIAAVGLTACGASKTTTVTATHTVTVAPSTQGSSTSSSSAGSLIGLKGEAARQKFDGKKPTKECGYEEGLSSQNVHTASSSPVYYPGQRFMGTLRVRQSNLCHAATAELFFSHLKQGTRIYIKLVRPGKYPKAEPYQTTNSLSPTYTGLLANDAVSGCVYAEAWLEINGSKTPPAVTACY